MTQSELKPLDLTVIENMILFAKNYKEYLPVTSLPKEIKEKILEWENHYESGIITGNELYNVILDVIVRFMDTIMD